MDPFKEQWMEESIKDNKKAIISIDKQMHQFVAEIQGLRKQVDKLIDIREREVTLLLQPSAKSIRTLDSNENPYKFFLSFVKDILLAIISATGGVLIALATGLLDFLKN